MKFTNLLECVTYFSDAKVATDYLIQIRWNGNRTCAHCNSKNTNSLKGKTSIFKCYDCRKQFSATKGTIFENSPIPLQKWFCAIYLHTSHKKGISSHQLARDLTLTQKSAWFVLQRVRFALKSGSFNPSTDGFVQCDETFVGGKEKNKHKSAYAQRQKELSKENGTYVPVTGRSTATKTAVVGMREHGGRVTAKVVPDASAESLVGFISDNIATGTTIVTDEYSGYNSLYKKYNHETVNHKAGMYVYNGFHTNGIENFWSHFKRGIIGIYHQVSDKHLDKYVDEFEFRYNTRKFGEVERFEKMLGLSNCRLTYKSLICQK